MADLTTDQIAIRNLCIKLQGFMGATAQTKGQEDGIETAMKLLCNTLIDVNRIANALEERNRLDSIQSAVAGLERRATEVVKRISFIYTNHRGETEEREV